MTKTELESCTVLQLRDIARENHVKLGAGIDKAGIIERIAAALCQEPVPAMQEQPAEAEVKPVSTVPAAPVYTAPAYTAPAAPSPAAPAQESAPQKPKFTLAYQAQPQYNRQPAYQARPAYDSRHTGADPLRPAPVQQRPVSYSRFGPGARQEPAQSAPVKPRPHWGEDSARSTQATRPVREENHRPTEQVPPMTLQEALSDPDLLDGTGVLDPHVTEGFGFLRGVNLQSTSKDIYISSAQLRRFNLRAGDVVTGKVRPQRDGDRYCAMLYVTEVNGQPAANALQRPLFDELTARYPERRIDLGSADTIDMRLLDLICPIGYGTRGLICTPPGDHVTELLVHLSAAIRKAAPDAELAVLSVGGTPEDAALLRSAAGCPIYSVGFEQTPEASFRTCDLALEHAMRGCEQGRDEILIISTVNRISKIGLGVAAVGNQQRAINGPVNPTGLYRAKKIFSGARSLQEGGSLTVLAVAEMAVGDKVDEAIASEFRSAANMLLTMDPELLGQCDLPADLTATGTKQQSIMVGPERDADLRLTHRLVSGGDPAESINHLADLIRRTGNNDVFLDRVRSWAATAGKK